MPGNDRRADAVRPLPAEDLDHVARLAHDVVRELDGARILITGAGGFLGSWMTETLCWASQCLDIRLQAIVLLRRPRHFARAFPHLAHHPAVTICPGDVLTAKLDAVDFTHVVHAAAPVSGRGFNNFSAGDFDNIVSGCRRLLEFSIANDAERFLYMSSGAVYGHQPPGVSHITEDFWGGLEHMSPDSLYGEAKRAAELLCASANRSSKIETVVARGFTFVGPRLPLDSCYAVGNFIADRIAKRPIRVKGDGTPWRSYLYAADAAVWLWTMLVRGTAGRAYNLGSDAPCTIGQLAREVSTVEEPVLPVVIENITEPATSSSCYVPSILSASSELNLAVQVDRRDAIMRTVRFHTGRTPLEGCRRGD